MKGIDSRLRCHKIELKQLEVRKLEITEAVPQMRSIRGRSSDRTGGNPICRRIRKSILHRRGLGSVATVLATAEAHPSPPVLREVARRGARLTDATDAACTFCARPTRSHVSCQTIQRHYNLADKSITTVFEFRMRGEESLPDGSSNLQSRNPEWSNKH